MLTPDYLEFTTGDVAASRAFYTQAFGFEHTDYGPEYTAIHAGDLEIGLVRSEAKPPLAGFRTDDLEAAMATIREAGGAITQEPYPFPGGRRFHFSDPGGNELMVYQADE